MLKERTYSGAIEKALKEMVRREDFQKAVENYEREVKKGDFFWPATST